MQKIILQQRYNMLQSLFKRKQTKALIKMLFIYLFNDDDALIK